MVWLGLSAWRSEPGLYQNTSSISPVDSLVLTMLSPSVPPGTMSVLIFMVGLARMKASASALVVVTVGWSLPMRNDRVTGPPSADPDEPDEPEPQEVRAANA